MIDFHCKDAISLKIISKKQSLDADSSIFIQQLSVSKKACVVLILSAFASFISDIYTVGSL